jgi:hypothetical protein
MLTKEERAVELKNLMLSYEGQKKLKKIYANLIEDCTASNHVLSLNWVIERILELEFRVVSRP